MMADDEERGSKDNTDPRLEPKNTANYTRAPGGHMGITPGGATQPTFAQRHPDPSEQAVEQDQAPQQETEQKSFDERLGEQQEEPKIGYITDDPEFNQELIDQGFTLIEEGNGQDQSLVQDGLEEAQEEREGPVDIPENRLSFSERFPDSSPEIDTGGEGPDLQGPDRDDGPELDR